MFKPREEIFDTVAFTIEVLVKGGFFSSTWVQGYDGDAAELVHISADGVAVVALVHDDAGPTLKISGEQWLALTEVGHVGPCNNKTEGIAQVRHRPCGSWSRGWLLNVLSLGRFGLRQVLRRADGFSSWCGRSSDTRRLVQRRLAPSTTPPQTAFSPATEGCVALFHGPKDGGRSSHGAPALKTHRIASMRRRSFAHLRPRRCGPLRLLRWPLIF